MAVTLVTWPKFCQEYNVCLGLSHLGASRFSRLPTIDRNPSHYADMLA